MKLTRRDFLTLIGTGIASSYILKSDIIDKQENIFYNNDSNINNNFHGNLILPKGLSEGSVIAISAPASPTSMGEIRFGMKFFSKLGCKIKVGDTIKNYETKNRYFSATDNIRCEEFMNYVKDTDVDCILCGRGGYGSMRLLNSLDFEAIKNNPKIYIGFSDITALITSIYRLCNIVTFHGPVAVSGFNEFTSENLQKIIFLQKEFKPVKVKVPDLIILNKGTATGKLVGGNLSIISSTLGTPYEIDTEDSILFIEEVSEEPYKVDRMLTQLHLAGKFDKCKAIVFGYFKNLNVKRNFWPSWSFTVKQILESRIIPLGIPSVIGLPIGHNSNNLTLPLGINAEINTKDKSFTILEQAVSN
jgi:muramoyltetrapeptide carboxypeptidase